MRSSRSLIALAVCTSTAFQLAACDAQEPASQKLVVGPSGYDVTSRPQTPYRSGWIKLEGCCYLDPGKSAVEEFFGDHQAWQLSGDGFQVFVEYGSTLDARTELEGARQVLVDGIKFWKVDPAPVPSKQILAFARIPTVSSSDVRVVEPTLTISGQCDDEKGCAEINEIVNSIRF